MLPKNKINLHKPIIVKVIIVKRSASAAASPQKPCSARFKIFIDASGVLKETRKITALIVPTPRTKLYTKALKKTPEPPAGGSGVFRRAPPAYVKTHERLVKSYCFSGKIIVKYVLIFPAPKEDAASSSDEFI